jgi:hypothetical protein
MTGSYLTTAVQQTRVAFLLAAATIASVFAATCSPSAAAQATETQVWYWSEQLVADALYKNGIDWPSIGRHDPVSGDTCWGLGPIARAGGIDRYRYFWCEARPQRETAYNVVVNVVAQSRYSVNFGGYTKVHRWYWTAQYVANALVSNGISWGGSVDPVTSDYCRAFGRSLASGGTKYYKHFFCSVQSSARRPYFVVVDVDAQNSYSVYWVDYDVRPQIAAPVPAASTTSSPAANPTAGHTVTVGGTYDPADGVAVIAPGGSSTTGGDGGTTFTFGGGGLGTVLTLADRMDQGRPGSGTGLSGLYTGVNNARANTAHRWAAPVYCEDPRDGHYWSCG